MQAFPHSHLVIVAALLSAGAAAIHAAVAGPHLQEYAPFGVLFIATALGQAAWSALVFTAPSRRLLAVGAVGNAGVVAAWVVSRTTGLPVGPAPWQPEAITALDLAATSFELGVVAASAALAVGGPDPALSARVPRRFSAGGATMVAALACAAFAAAPNPAHHEHGAPADSAKARGLTQVAERVPTKQPSKAANRAASSTHHAHGTEPHSHP